MKRDWGKWTDTNNTAAALPQDIQQSIKRIKKWLFVKKKATMLIAECKEFLANREEMKALEKKLT
jgi:Fe-S cluster biosynthesis and repair protein YggX